MDHLDLERKEVLGLIEEQSEFVMRGTICPLEYPAEGSNLFEQNRHPSYRYYKVGIRLKLRFDTIQTYSTKLIDIWMKNLCHETHFGWRHRVFLWQE